MKEKRKKNLLIVGSTGLLGYEFTKQIINDGKFEEITTTSRNKDKQTLILNKEKHIFGDFSKSIFWEKVLRRNPDIIILISNCRHFFALEKAIKSNRINTNNIKFIIIGTTGVFSPVKNYSEIYKIIEEKIKNIKFKNYIIIRPTLIYGSIRDQNVHKVINFIKKYKFFLSLSGNLGSIQPVYYKDVINSMINSIYRDDLNGTFNITGKDCLNYYDFYSLIFKSLKIKKRIFQIPFYLSLSVAYIIEKLSNKKFFINVERIRRLKEKKCFSNKDAIEQDLYIPTSFSKGISIQINEIEKL